jgi:hypothetical protein
MSDREFECLLTSFAFGGIACLTWYISSRPHGFLRVFVPSDQLREAARQILHDPQFKRSTRLIAVLQFGVAAIILLGSLTSWLLF